jgi:hypothetical protein
VAQAERRTVDLSAYPDLVVIYLGMRSNSAKGFLTMLKFGPSIQKAVDAKPDGLLLHERIIWGWFPPHFGMRQYWRDFDSLESWSRSLPHQGWWQRFLRDTGGTGFWHEAYFMRGGMEAIFDTIPAPLGFTAFAPVQPARGPLFSARSRARLEGEPTQPEAIPEDELYRT